MRQKLLFLSLFIIAIGFLTSLKPLDQTEKAKCKICYTPEYVITESGDYEALIQVSDLKHCKSIVVPIKVRCDGLNENQSPTENRSF
ncbi:MAG: hypothetical protein ABI851_12065 [Saprospiraceae bacterium]